MMNGKISDQYIINLINRLSSIPHETEWIEFKINNAKPESIGEYISALANSAALLGQQYGYIVWGIHDDTHEIVGTAFDPANTRNGNEILENWLLRLLEPKIDIRFFSADFDGKRVVLLEIPRATIQPVRFSNQEYIRIGSYKKNLKDFPEKERSLWRIFDQASFESEIALEGAAAEEVLKLLDYPSYFDLLNLPLPESQSNILDALEREQLIRRVAEGIFDITNLGAISIARNLSKFSRLKRKVIRVIQYRGSNRTFTIKEQELSKGYANGFSEVIRYISSTLPTNEVIQQAIRKSVPMFPELAIRELVANALIHQDFFITGACPMIEIFDDRIEITNPGQPLIDIERFLDSPPRSRNETLAALMRRFGICEERGSGIDKVVSQVEIFQLPAPLFESPNGFTRAVLFSHKSLSAMGKDDRIRACYLHACLCYVTGKMMTNTTLRNRFGIAEHNRAIVSRLIREAVESGFIVPADPTAAPKLKSYLPFWAARKKGERT